MVLSNGQRRRANKLRNSTVPSPSCGARTVPRPAELLVREEVEKALAEGDKKILAPAGRETIQAFADTQVMHSKL